MARTDPRPNYGSKRRVRDDGYVDLWVPGHPMARGDGYVFEHRAVLAGAGVDIPPRHQVHHKNGDRQDNRLENLEVVRIDQHTRLHWKERGKPTHCPQGHEFNEENTAHNPSGWRYCKECNRQRARAWNARKKAERQAAA